MSDRQWNSTLRRPKKPMPRGKKPLAKAGKTKAKKVVRYAEYMRSAAWKKKRAECIARAGGQCEVMLKVEAMGTVLDFGRCPNEATDAHHKSYVRFREELPRDLLACCERHHDAIEATSRPWNRGRKFA